MLLYFYSVLITGTGVFPKLVFEGGNNSTNHSNCTWRSDMRSWQDWFPDGEAISSLVPLPYPCPNSEKEKGQNKV